MNQENVFSQSQSTNSQNDPGHQALEEIKDQSEEIMEQKRKDDFELNKVLKDLQNVRKLIEEKNQQIIDAEKENSNLENVMQQLEKTRGSFKTDVENILRSRTEYFEIFHDLKTSVQNIQSEVIKNEDIIENFSTNRPNCSGNSKSQKKIQQSDNENKLLEDLKESNAKLKIEKTKYLDNKKMMLLNLEKEEQNLLAEIKMLQNKEDELKKEFDIVNKLKDDFENELKIDEGKYNAVLQKLDTEKIDIDKLIKEIESNYNAQKEKITDLEKMLEQLGVERLTQNSSIEQTKLVFNCLVQRLSYFENKVIKRADEVLKFKKMIEELRSESSKFIDEDKKLLENLDERILN